MIIIKTPEHIGYLRESGRVAGTALLRAKAVLRAGMTTLALDELIHDYILSQGATPSFLGYNGFPLPAVSA